MLSPRKALFFTAAFCSSLSSVWAADYQPNEVIVKYKEGIVRSRSTMNQIYNNVGVVKIHRSGLFRGLEHLNLDGNKTVEQVVSELRQDPTVEYAQPNYILRALPIETQANDTLPVAVNGVPCIFPGIPFPPGCDDGSQPTTRPELKPAPGEVNPPVADPDLSKAYGLEKVGAPQAWAIHRGDKAFVVADIDTGFDYNHTDLAGNVWRNPNPSDKSDIAGFDFIHNDGLPYDDNGHGTHTAGTIGAVGGNGVGISGVIQKVSIMSLKFLSGQGSGTTADAIKAIDYAVAHGAKILSNSWGGKGDPDNKALGDAIERAKEKDVLFVAAAGNDGTDNDGSNPSYPAAFPNDNMLSVAATNSSDMMASFSNYGKKTTHVGAPGEAVYSLMPGDKYKNLSGTSMACPHVAGAAALLWSYHPKWTYKQVKEVLMKTVDPLPALAEKTVTGGRINVFKALQSAL
ncbi:MAG: S8 family serine peptidase [Bdellovibrio sp.]|nr:S8 family serine peptidase [Bdellovibrio sp.]